MPLFITDDLWAGTEASLHDAIKNEETLTQRMAAGASYGEDQDEDSPRLLEVKDGVGFIKIHGSLNNSDSPWNKLFSVTGYPEIREALVYAATDPEVKHIFLDINSGGGSVSGLDDTAKLIRKINDKVKGVTAFTDSAMYSAAYWLGSAAGSVHSSKGAGVGSIGVIAFHMERSKQLADAGIGVNVIRSAENKALANGYEKLSDKGRAQIQAAVDTQHNLFVEHVAEMRGKSTDYVRQVIATGQEFYGQAAADASLVDSITTFDDLVSRISAKIMDTSNSFMDNRGKQNSHLRAESIGDTVMVKKTLTEQDIAALAAGVNVGADVSAETLADEVVGAAPETGAEADVVADAAADVQDQEVKPEAAAEVAKMDATVKFVSDQLKAAQDDLFATRLELSRLQDKHAEISAVVTPLKEIAAKAVNNMRVALGSAPLDMGAMSAAQVVAEHLAVASNFMKQFPVGGVASVSGAAEKEKKEFKLDSNLAARVNAVRGK